MIGDSGRLHELETDRKAILDMFLNLNISTFSLTKQGLQAIKKDYAIARTNYYLEKVGRLYQAVLRSFEEKTFNSYCNQVVRVVSVPTVEKFGDNAASTLHEIYLHWFGSVYSAILNYIVVFDTLSDLIKTDKESAENLVQGVALTSNDNVKGRVSSNLFTVDRRLWSGLIYYTRYCC